MNMTFSGLNELLEYVEKLESSWKPDLLDVAGETLVSLTRERFSLGKDPYDKPWAVSARAMGQGGQTLRDKGILANSFTWQGNGADSLVYGTNVFYAEVHQNGMRITPKRKKALRFNVNGSPVLARAVTIPKRAMVPDDRGDPQPYDAELHASLETALTATLGKLIGKGAFNP
jgi:phage gpG-like protein